MTGRRLASLLLCISLASGAAEPGAQPKPGMAGATEIARISMRGMISLLESGGGGLRGTPAAFACARKLQPSELAPMFLRVLEEDFTVAEREQFDQFVGSSASRKAARLGEIDADRERGTTSPGETPVLTADDEQQLAKYDALMRRVHGAVQAKPELRSQVNSRMVKLLQQCGFR